MNFPKRLSSLVALLVVAACSDSADLPTAPAEVEEPHEAQLQVILDERNYVVSPSIALPEGMAAVHTPFIRIAGIGGNYGNRAANTIISTGDIHGSIDRLSAYQFNQLSVQDLIDSYDVLIFTWASSGVNADWATVIEPYLAAGRGVVWEDDGTTYNLSDIVTTGCGWCASGSFSVIPFPPLTDGINNTFVNNHITMTSWASWLTPYLMLGSHVVGLAGVAPNGGHLMVSGPDQDYHAVRGSNQYNLLVNQILWLAEPAVGNEAPTADAGGAYTGEEGSAVTFSAAGSDDPDGDNADLTYAWTFGDGATGTGVAPSHTYADNGTYVVTVTVEDADGGTDVASSTATIGNVAPTVDAGSGGTIESGDAFTLSGSFTDPGADDAPFASEIDWGDGSTSSGTTGSHTYYAPGTYTVTLTVTDKDGGVGSSAVSVEVTRKSILIDIKPGSDKNPINLGESGVTPVAILTGNGFDATTIDRSTLAFGPGGATPAHNDLGHVEDVDDDGDMDLMTHYPTSDLGIAEGDTSACVTGVTESGIAFVGCDVVAPKASKAKGNGR